MAFSKREKYIGIGAGAAVVILGLNSMVIDPFIKQRDELAKQYQTALDQQDKNDHTRKMQVVMKRVWAEMNAGGLKADPSEAESQLLHAIRDWAQESGVNRSALKPERAAPENKFMLIGCHFTGTGNMASIARMLWKIETTTIPIRVNDIQIAPQREGRDELTLQISVSTLSPLPETEKKPGQVAVALATGVR